MIDVTDQGWVYNPKTQPEGVGEQDDAVAGVRMVQVSGRYILGGVGSHWVWKSGNAGTDVNSYFLLDTQIGKHTVFSTHEYLIRTASQLGIQPNLESIDTVYSRYRFTWFDIFVAALLFVPLLIYFLLLTRHILKLRRVRDIALSK